MKQCPRCNRTYADDTLSYCLEDGAALIKGYDPDATQISPFPSSSPPAPTIYAGFSPPPSVPATPPAGQPVPPPPAPRRGFPIGVGAMVLAALVVGLLIGGFIFQSYSPSSSDAAAVSPTPRLVTTAPTKPTPAPATPTPMPTATPSQMATPSPSIVQSKPESEPNCVLYNDVADAVRVRTNCDTQDCDNDKSTIAGEYPDNTPVSLIKGGSVRGERFTWVKVVIKESGQMVWVASSKIKCK